MSLAVNKILNASYEGIVLGVIFQKNPEIKDVAVKGFGGISRTMSEILEESSERVFFYKAKQAVEIGRHVVVPTPRGFTVAVVYSVLDETALDLDYSEAYKWVVGPVDFTEYTNCTGEDEALVSQVTKAQRQNIRQQVLESVRSVGLDPALLIAQNIEKTNERIIPDL